MDRMRIAYWTTTSLFGAAMLAGGIAGLMQVESLQAEVLRLGYPHYLLTVLGLATLVGVVALLAPGLPLLKEWAYVGFGVGLVVAAASRLIMADPIADTARPIVMFLIAGSSYLTRPASRRLSGTPSWQRQGE